MTAPAPAPAAGAPTAAAPERAAAGAVVPIKKGCGTGEAAPAQPEFTDFPEGCTYDTKSTDSKCSVDCGKGTRPVKKTGGPATCPETFNLPCYDCICPCVFERSEWGVCRTSNKLAFRSTIITTPAGADAVLTKCPPTDTQVCNGCEVVDGKSTCPSSATVMTLEELAAYQKKEKDEKAAAAAALADLKKKCVDDFNTKGVWGSDCDCKWPESQYGCCQDGTTAAAGINNQGCCGYAKDPKIKVVGICKTAGWCGKNTQAPYACSASSEDTIKLSSNGDKAIFSVQTYSSRKLDMRASLEQDGDTALPSGTKAFFAMFPSEGIGGVVSGYFTIVGLSEQTVIGGRVRFFDAPTDKPDSTDCKERGAEYATGLTQYDHSTQFQLVFGADKEVDKNVYVWSKPTDTKVLYANSGTNKFAASAFAGKRVVLEDTAGKPFLCGVVEPPGVKPDKKTSTGAADYSTCFCDSLCSLRGACCDNINADCGYQVIDYTALFG